MPVAVKSAIDVRGYHNAEGTRFLAAHKGPAGSDSAAIHRLRAAGAIIVGTTCMHEIGMGVTGQSIHEGRGPHRNPHNLSHYAGGSSSGRFVPGAICNLNIAVLCGEMITTYSRAANHHRFGGRKIVL